MYFQMPKRSPGSGNRFPYGHEVWSTYLLSSPSLRWTAMTTALLGNCLEQVDVRAAHSWTATRDAARTDGQHGISMHESTRYERRAAGTTRSSERAIWWHYRLADRRLSPSAAAVFRLPQPRPASWRVRSGASRTASCFAICLERYLRRTQSAVSAWTHQQMVLATHDVQRGLGLAAEIASED